MGMIDNVTTTLDSSNAHVTTGFFQLQNIHLPTALSNAITAKQTALEYVDVVYNEREQILIQAETELLTAQQLALIVEIEAQANADASVINARAEADARLLEGEAEAAAILVVAQEEALARTQAWNFTNTAIMTNVAALNVSMETYVDEYLMPKLTADVLDPEITSCLSQADVSNPWYCFVGSA